jgi:GNAT superfamily N-acetyltransferase
MSLKWSDEPPGVGEYVELRRIAGIGARSAAAAAAGLKGGLHCVTGRERGRLIAMGRVVGDGGTVAHIVDVCVDPGWRGRGIGSEVMTRLMEWCRAGLPDSCCLSLIADPGSYALYRRHGFEIRTGMARRLP